MTTQNSINAPFPFSPTIGGTGVNNGSSTITIGGNVTLNGAYTFSATFTGNTNVTFPTSGTLATVGATVASITGTANQVLANATFGVAQTGAVTLTTPQDIGTTSNVVFNALQLGGLTASQLTGTDASKNLISGNLTGDVTTSAFAATVAKINGNPLGTTTPTYGNLLYGNGTQWEIIPGNITAAPLVLTSTGDGTTSTSLSWQPLPVTGILVYYLTDTAAGIGADYKQTVDPLPLLTSLTTAGLIDGQLVYIWITDLGAPGRDSLPAGQYSSHLHLAKTAGSSTLQIRAEVWETDSAGVDIAKIADLGPSTTLTGSNAEYIIADSVVEYTMASASSRIATKLYAVVGASGSAPTIVVYMGDGSDSRTDLPAANVDATNFVPYTGATADVNLGLFDLTATSINVSGLTASYAVVTDVSKNLASLQYTNANTVSTLVQRDGSGNFSAGTITATLSGTATNATNTAITNDTTTNATMYPTWVTTTTGNLPQKVSSTKLTFNPSTGTLTATTFSGAFSGTATNATNIGITDDTATNATMYPVWVTANTGNLPAKVTSTKLSFNPSTGLLNSDILAGPTQTRSSSARIYVTGTNNSATAGPHQAFYTASDQYPILQILPYSHNNSILNFDAYWDGAWRSSVSNSNFQIQKSTTTLQFNYGSGTAAGSSFSWTTGFTLNTSGQITVSGLTASYAVVTDGSKNLASLQYTTTATASALVQRDASNYIYAVGLNLSKAGGPIVSDYLTLSDSSQALNNKNWGIGVAATKFTFYTQNDAQSSSTNWLEVLRSGNNITSMTFPMGIVAISATTASTTATTGALTVAGGVGIVGDTNTTGNITTSDTGLVAHNVTSTTTGSTNEAALLLTRGDAANGYAQIKVATGATVSWAFGIRAPDSKFRIWDNVNSIEVFSIDQGAIAAGAVNVLKTTVSSSTSTGALVVSGGVGIGGKVFAGGAFRTTDTTVSSSTTTGSGIFDGGVGIAGALNVGGTITGNLAVANESADSTCFPTFVTASGTTALPLKTNTGWTFNSVSGAMSFTSLTLSSTAPIIGTKQSYPVYTWVEYDASGPTVRASGNVSSLTDNGVGKIGVNMTTAMADASYAVVGFCRNEVAGGDMSCNLEQGQVPTSSAFRMAMGRYGTGFVDSIYVNAMVVR